MSNKLFGMESTARHRQTAMEEIEARLRGHAVGTTSRNLWQKPASLMNAGLNHVQQGGEQHTFFWRLKNHYDGGTGADFKINESEFEYLLKKGTINHIKAKNIGDGLFRAPINFYNSDKDLALSFGNAWVFYKMEGAYKIYYDFNDTYDFDSKPWGKGRSIPNEIITRGYNLYSNGKSFRIYCKKFYF